MNLPRLLSDVKPCIADMNFLDAITLIARYQEERIKPRPAKKKPRASGESVTVSAAKYRSKGKAKTRKPRTPKSVNIDKIDLTLLSKLTNLNLERTNG